MNQRANGSNKVLFYLVALFLHYPGLKLFYGLDRTHNPWGDNLSAILCTMAAMYITHKSYPLDFSAIFFAWAIGHLLWGMFLARWVSHRSMS